MHRGRRMLLAGLGPVLGVCVTAVGCQTTSSPRLAAGPGARTVVATSGEARPTEDGKIDRKWGLFRPAAAPAQEKPAATAGAWRPAARPGEAARPSVVPAGYPPTDSPPPEVAGGPALEPPRADSAPPFEMHAPRLVPVPMNASPAPREVAHTIVGPVAGQTPRELFKQAMPAYRVEPPDILLIEVVGAKPPDQDGKDDKPPAKDGKDDKPGGAGGLTPIDSLNATQPIRGPHLVRPDGTVSLGVWGSVFVGGMTLEEIRQAIANHLTATRVRVDVREVNVDVVSYNSKFYYVIFDGGGYGEQVVPFVHMGSETVLDAIAKVGGLPAQSDKTKIWVARRGPGAKGQILPVDWVGITQHGGTASNPQIIPGDRIYVKADHWVKFDNELGKRLTPIERIFGGILLGSEAVNSIRNSGTTR